jgi:outer membrane lipoprotein-sorting protein
MRRASLCALLLLPAAFSGAQSVAEQQMGKFIKALNSAQTLSVNYTSQVIGGTSTTYKLEYGKPNLAKIDSPTEQIVADGTNITTYDKKKKTYFKRKQTDKELRKIIVQGDMYMWAGFFDPDMSKGLKNLRSLGTKTRNGVVYNALEFILASGRQTTVTYYLSQSDLVARQAVFSVKSGNTTDIVVFDAKSVALGAKADPALYAFKAPEGSRELTEAEMNAAKWYTNLDEAIQVAKSSNRMVFVFFTADW